ncbi:hypothetical protein GCM10010988_41910 [Cnuibacter physcomitrellae]|uniref:Uncharacterized protein n=1 Tax=Cnuibacter physcomitrellae TaxID=1619308 RepID=A0A1X9LRE8_9MICO|nr:copper resistance CopC family protein [Cnuibacter physcomitrellae]ARJ07753.1 hypothetical protein B5808_20375 [Cnuibacter physcomitrellae]GGI43011.1 hypothetical protein GCM10010988_41910 [Cnuibacter physcomitrellae]
MTRHLRLSLTALALTLLATLGIVSPAQAHDALSAADPAPDSTVSTPLTTVTLTFNEAPLDGFDSAIAIAVLDPAGTDVSTGSVGVTDTVLSKAVSPTIAGTYQVLWQTVSTDGHPISGQYAFSYTVEPSPIPTPTAGETTTSTASPSTATPAPEPSPSSTAIPGDTYDTTFPIALIVGAVVIAALLTLGIVLGFRVRRRTTFTPKDGAP